MNDIVDRALREVLRAALACDAGSEDRFSTPAAYRAWAVWLRPMLCRRYVRRKREALEWMRCAHRRRISPQDIRDLILRMLGDAGLSRWQRVFCRSSLPLGVFTLAVVVLVVRLDQELAGRQFEHALREGLPAYVDASFQREQIELTHQELAHQGAESPELFELEEELLRVERDQEARHHAFLAQVPTTGGLRTGFEEALEIATVPSEQIDVDRVTAAFAALDTRIEALGWPYVIDPIPLSVECWSMRKSLVIDALDDPLSSLEEDPCTFVLLASYRVARRMTVTTGDQTVEIRQLRRLDDKDYLMPTLTRELADGPADIFLDTVDQMSRDLVLGAFLRADFGSVASSEALALYQLEQKIRAALLRSISEAVNVPGPTLRAAVLAEAASLAPGWQPTHRASIQVARQESVFDLFELDLIRASARPVLRGGRSNASTLHGATIDDIALRLSERYRRGLAVHIAASRAHRTQPRECHFRWEEPPTIATDSWTCSEIHANMAALIEGRGARHLFLLVLLSNLFAPHLHDSEIAVVAGATLQCLTIDETSTIRGDTLDSIVVIDLLDASDEAIGDAARECVTRRLGQDIPEFVVSD